LQLELSGPKLKVALEALVSRADEQGGVEAYVNAVQIKSALFRDALSADLTPSAFRALCAHMATVRRRIGSYAEPDRFDEIRPKIEMLLKGTDTASTDVRVAEFCGAFPDDRDHRWVRDLAAELLHYADPERYPLMTRWVWDLRANTGVLREIWHGEDVDHVRLEVPDSYDTFVQLRQELAQYLSANGVYRDQLFYVDVLCAQVYAGYIGERGGAYLRADFATAEDPMLHTRRILGLDGVNASGRTRLKSLNGRAEIVQ
jgi:hypothetical protein